MATWNSTPSTSPSHHRSPQSRTATTSRGSSSRTPNSLGQSMASNLPQGTLHSRKNKNTTSPSYFGFPVGTTSDPPNSSPGHHPRQIWDYPCSDARDTPSIIPVEANLEFEAFRRQSEHDRFNLGHGTMVAPANPQGPQQALAGVLSGQSAQSTPVSPRPITISADRSQPAVPPISDMDQAKIPSMAFFDRPRRDSPASLSPGQTAAMSHRHARLSLPANHLHTLPPHPGRTPVQRAETLPEVLHKEGLAMFSSQQFVALLQSLPRDVLLLDLRVAPQYATSRVRGALNLCIPTTLMKRPSFNTQKLRDIFGAESDREKFSRWRDCSHIAVYDSSSNTLKDAQNPVNVLKKFLVEGWVGQGVILKGGFAALSKTHPSMVDHGSSQNANTSNSSLAVSPSIQAVAPVAGGCPMPQSKTAANPFFNNIRQNMDLMDGVGQLPVTHPAGMSSKSENALPEWLKKAVEEKNKGKLVSDGFLAIERTEQRRMQEALNCTVSYGSPRAERAGKVQIAGVEKGAKNRYNNIFPYDHSRVRLQIVASEGCDYINASYIKASYSHKRYIATQAPIPATFSDFWRLVWEQDVRVIAMLTAESEGGLLKSHPYWQTGDYGPLKLKLRSEKRISLGIKATKPQQAKPRQDRVGSSLLSIPSPEGQKVRDMDPIPRAPETPFVTVRHFTLFHSNLPFQPLREITQLQYSQWPDFGAPAHPQHLLALIEQTSKYIKRNASPSHSVASEAGEPAPEDQRPIIVHCSAGCGRTGTFCTVDSVIDMLKRQRKESGQDKMELDSGDEIMAGEWINRGDVDLIAKTVEDFRGQRLSMVQSLRQFVLCYESVLDWVVEQELQDEGLDGKEGRRGLIMGDR